MAEEERSLIAIVSQDRKSIIGKMLSSRLLKAMSIIIVACMLVTLTACGTTVSQQDARQTTTEYSTIVTSKGGLIDE